MDTLQTTLGERRRQCGVIQHARDGLRQRGMIAGRHLQSPIRHHLLERSAVARHQRDAGRHRLNRGQTKALIQGGHNCHRTLCVKTVDVVVTGITDKSNAVS